MKFITKNNPIVCYLFTCFDNIDSIINFKNNYLKFNSGFSHNLVICFKLLNQKQITNIIKELSDLEFINFVDPYNENDFDFGTYKRVAELYHDKQIFFLNSHSYPICENWLLKLMSNSGNNILIGTSASNESLLDSFKLKKKYKIFSYLFRKMRLKRKFNIFPNPHLRTSSFLIKGDKLFDYLKYIKIQNKEDAWEIESGKQSLTNYFRKNNFDIFVINSDGSKFTEDNWIYSETYCYSKQLKSIISDKHTRKYLALSEKDQISTQFKVWGK
ncbi:hypothetical protein IDG58_04235 [Pelagibacterales bacterium SAG-MED19]|nr:hypothetical protein [Pelagibacterales bacterium SAG-MED19]